METTHGLSGQTKFDIYGEELTSNQLEIVEELAALIEDECTQRAYLDSLTRCHVLKIVAEYLRGKWQPLIVTCDESNNRVLYKYERRVAPRDLRVDIMFHYRCSLSIVYSKRVMINKKHTFITTD